MQKGRSVGFVSTRLSGTDGVSLESAKWEHVFARNGFSCCYWAGELDRPTEHAMLVPEAHFLHPDVRALYAAAFSSTIREPATTDGILALKTYLKGRLREFLTRFEPDLLVVENALAIPMHIPLGLALTELIAETGVPTLAHHHDLFWERTRFLTNCVWDYLNMAFPPHLPFVRHVVINSSASNQLSLRTGISATTIPNVMDYTRPPPEPDAYAADVRRAFGVADDELFVLQPTRVVPRKGIEHAIELVSRLGRKAKLIISHASGDEGHAYEARLKAYSRALNVETYFVSEHIADKRGVTAAGAKIYTLEDVYPHADLVTYPSTLEGFGNAFLEAVYYRRPIMVNSYSIYDLDIRPKGFQCIELDGYVSEETVAQVREVLADAPMRDAMTRRNYELARECFSYDVLERKLRDILEDMLGGAGQRTTADGRAFDGSLHCCVCRRRIQVLENRIRLELGGQTHVVCSEPCRQELLKRPERYGLNVEGGGGMS